MKLKNSSDWFAEQLAIAGQQLGYSVTEIKKIENLIQALAIADSKLPEQQRQGWYDLFLSCSESRRKKLVNAATKYWNEPTIPPTIPVPTVISPPTHWPTQVCVVIHLSDTPLDSMIYMAALDDPRWNILSVEKLHDFAESAIYELSIQTGVSLSLLADTVCLLPDFMAMWIRPVSEKGRPFILPRP